MCNVSIGPSQIHGKGVFAKIKFTHGQRIGYFEGYEVNIDTQHSFFVKATGQRIEPTGPLRYLNHSCDANAHFEGRWLCASREIKEGEEITLDYLDAEQPISNSFSCRCGALNCRGRIQGPKIDDSPSSEAL